LTLGLLTAIPDACGKFKADESRLRHTVPSPRWLASFSPPP
jgi:hypothetical protein